MNFLISKHIVLACAVSVSLLLSGCSSLGTKQEIDNVDWAFSGKMAIRSATEATSFNVNWQQVAQSYHIRLFGPLGAGEITINGRPGNVTMTHDDKMATSNSLSDLAYQATNMDLPLDYLQFWVRAKPAPKTSFSLTKNANGQVTEIAQAGWVVSISDYFDEVPARPRKLSFAKERDSGKLVIREWNPLPQTE